MEIVKSIFGGFRLKFGKAEIIVLGRYVKELKSANVPNVEHLLGSMFEQQLRHVIMSVSTDDLVVDKIEKDLSVLKLPEE